jgi:hypothetical protein
MKWLLAADDWVNNAIILGDSSGLFDASKSCTCVPVCWSPMHVCRVLIPIPEGQDRHRQRIKA